MIFFAEILLIVCELVLTVGGMWRWRRVPVVRVFAIWCGAERQLHNTLLRVGFYQLFVVKAVYFL